MNRYILLAGVASALAIAPTAAFAGNGGGNDGYYDDSITFGNHVSTTVENASYEFGLTWLYGGVKIDGNIDPNSAANAITDAKQIMSNESVSFSDPASSNGQGDDDGCGNNGKCDDKNGNGNNKTSSNPATVRNNATAGNVTSDGNTGANVAAGQYNMQQNTANIAMSDNDKDNAKGWASASTTAYQSLTDTTYGQTSGGNGNSDKNNGNDGGHYNDRNNATSGRVDSDGNVGVNVVAGAFNQQQNVLTLAVANNAVLAQSNAVLWQTASCNTINIQDQRNNAESGNISGAGNIGVNVAAGVGNQQQNSLTAAVSGSFHG